MQRLAAEFGNGSAAALVNTAFGIVEATGKPDLWIRAVGRARDRGVISPAVAHFVIFKLAESAATRLADAHPVLSRLAAQIERIEREHGVEEDGWTLNEAPAEWRSLSDEWTAEFDELITDLLLRNGEREIAEAYVARDEARCTVGMRMIFGAK